MLPSHLSPGFLAFLTPLIERAGARLRAGIDLLPEPAAAVLPPLEELETMLFAGARGGLERIITPTLALELNVARLRGELRGQSPQARFAHFVERLTHPDYAGSLATEYPALLPLAAVRLDLWVNASLEFLGRLVADWPAIQSAFFYGASPGSLTGLRFPQRSTKHGGRAVVLLSFESGARLAYKPRSMAVEVGFNNLLRWMNRSGFEPEFRSVTVLERESHGWMEWIDSTGCATTAEVRRFYRRQGAYLALFYALEATDLHMSNIIAAGEHPALIDLETLFHPRSPAPDWPALDIVLDDAIYYSVLRPGLLPEPETAEDGCPDRLDLSGLAGVGGQRTPYAVPSWRDRGTDAMRLQKERKTIGGSKNLPVVDGKPVNPVDYLNDLETGFTDAFRLLIERREELAADGGLLARFARAETRVLPRSGRHYGAILEDSYHPDLLRDPESRRSFLADSLRRGADDEAGAGRLTPHELADMLVGDTPSFTTRTGSRAIAGSRGKCLRNFYSRSGLDVARQRIGVLDEADLARQRWFIRASFATVAAPGAIVEGRLTARPSGAAPDLPVRALAEAQAIAARLARQALRAGDEASWIGLEPDEYGHWSIEPLGDGLAHGLPGIILFLSQLAALTNEHRWRDLARAARTTFIRYLAEAHAEGDRTDPIGLFDGVGGQLYGMARLAALDPDSSTGMEMGRLIERADALLRDSLEDEPIGLADGLAGLLAGLMAAQATAPGPDALPVARRAAGLLLNGLKAVTNSEEPEPFDAYYHGPAGAIGPLLALGEATDDGQYHEAARLLLAQVITPEMRDTGLWQAYWLARPWLDDDARRVLDAELASTLPELASSFTGDPVFLDFALAAAAELDTPGLGDWATRLATSYLDDLQSNGPRMMTPLGVETPGLVAGLAGVGYALLRVAAPSLVPPLIALTRQREAIG